MSSNFALKDFTFSFSKNKYYIFALAFVYGGMIYLLNLSLALGFLSTATSPDLFNITIIELFSQFNEFLITLSVIILIGMALFVNSNLIQGKKRDIGIMKAIGVDKQKLYSLYLYELFYTLLFGFFLGGIFGLVAYVISLVIFESLGLYVIFVVELNYTMILTVATVVIVYFVNGFELRKIGRKTFLETQRGYVPKNYDHRVSSPYKWLLHAMPRELRFVLLDLKRRRRDYNQIVIILTLTSAMIFTALLGYFTLDSTARNYVQRAQPNNMLAVCHQDLTNPLLQGYERFSNESIPEDLFNVTHQFLEESYALPSSFIDQINSTSQDNILQIEPRLFGSFIATERLGYLLPDEDTLEYAEFGQNRSQLVPVMGFNYESRIIDWEYEGSLNLRNDQVILGDTIAHEMFDKAGTQRVSIHDSFQQKEIFFQIGSTIVDTFNRGSVIYAELDYLQDVLNKSGYVNLLLIQYNGDSGTFNEIEGMVTELLPDDFQLLELELVFEQNIRSLSLIQWWSLVLGIVLAAVVIFAVRNFQVGRIEENRRDFQIMRAIGAKGKMIQNILWLSGIIVFFIGKLLGLIIAMYISLFFLLEGVFLPPLSLPFTLFGIIFLLNVILNKFISVSLSRKIEFTRFQHLK